MLIDNTYAIYNFDNQKFINYLPSFESFQALSLIMTNVLVPLITFWASNSFPVSSLTGLIVQLSIFCTSGIPFGMALLICTKVS